MFSLKWAWMAVAIEVGVFLSPMLHQTSTRSMIIMASLHIMSSLIVATGCYLLLPKKYQSPKIPVWLLLFLFAFAAPVVGAPGLILTIRFTLRQEQLQRSNPEPAIIPLPVFDVQTKNVKRSGQGSIRSRLNSHVPEAIRLQSLITLQAIPTRVANPILAELLSDDIDDVRLVAFGMLDAKEKLINADIQRERSQLDHANSDAQRYTCLRHLAELHWELIYTSLAQGELKTHILGKALQYVNEALAYEQDAAMLFLRGRILIGMGDYVAAQSAIEKAIALGHPSVSALPYLAELAFLQRDFAGVKQALSQLENCRVASRSQAVMDLWAGHLKLPQRNDRVYLTHI